MQFSFRASSKLVGGAVTCAPLAIYVGITDTHIKGIVAHLHLSIFNGRIPHGFTPVIQIVHSHSSTWLNLRGTLPRRGEGRLEKCIIVGDILVETLSILLKTEEVGFTRRHTQRWMPNGIIFFIGPLLYPFRECWKRPDCLTPWICRFCQESGLLCRLSIAEQMVQELCLQRTEEPFLWRTKSWFRGWTLMFTYPVECEQLFKVHALEFGTTINGYGSGEAPIALHTQTQDGEARTITWRIEGQIVGCNASWMRKNQERQPALSERLTSSWIAQEHIPFGVLEVSHCPR